MKYVHQLKQGIYLGNGHLNPVADINEAKVFNRPQSITQTSAWSTYGGSIIPVQTCVQVIGEAVADSDGADWATEYLEERLKSLGIVK